MKNITYNTTELRISSLFHFECSLLNEYAQMLSLTHVLLALVVLVACIANKLQICCSSVTQPVPVPAAAMGLGCMLLSICVCTHVS